MILKVQVSLFTTEVSKQALVYNEDRSVHWHGDADDDLLRAMGGSAKDFFYGSFEDGKVTLDRRAPWQGW